MSYQISGEFAVDSREKNGTFFTNDLERAVSLIFTAFGTWNTGSGSKNNYGPEGKIGARNKKTPYPDSTLYALLAVNSKNEVVGEGATIKLTLQSNESIRLMVNDTDYTNNRGELTVDWQQDAPVAGPLSAADGIMANETIDIAIVGGGISGVYCAWKLQQANPTKKIVLFEGSDHIGGRLLSVSPPDIENMVAELGGMRILPGVQPRIEGLIETLGLEEELYDFPVDDPQNIAYLRGVHLRLSDFSDHPDKVPYQLPFLEQGGNAGTIIINAIEQIVPGITNPNLKEEERREMAQNAYFDGLPLYKQGFWNILLRVISSEGYQLGIDAGGYSSTLANWNAADAIPWYLSDFGTTAKYKGFKNGFQQVPILVKERFEEAGGEVRLNTRLEGFHRHGDMFQLDVKPKHKLQQTINANQLILAMPCRSLDLLTPTSQPLQGRRMQRLIASVTPRPLFKLFTTYNNPWWRAAGHTNKEGQYVAVESGRTVTDLPVRQTYYWPTNDGTPAVEGPAMLMASYDDGRNVGYWDALRPRRGQAWQAGDEVAAPAVPFVSPNPKKNSDGEWDKYRASKRMVKEAARQLGIVHGLSYTPNVQNAAFRDWGDDPFGGGWNSWNIGVDSRVVKKEITNPMKGLYICGEAYSDAQGWVEGALQTADMVLANFNHARV